MNKGNKSNQQDSRLMQNSINKTSVDNIKKANAAMRDELNAEMRLSSLTNAQTGSKIAKLQEKGTFYAKQIEVEAKKLHDLERHIEMVQNSIAEKRAKLQKVEGNSSDSLGKQIKQLERKLDKTLQKHNEILADNRQLKEEIDHLRRERVTFDKIYKKLEVELQEKKKTLQEVFENSKKAKARKQNIEEQIKNLKLRVRKEESNIEKEFQDVFRDINEQNVADRIEEKFGTLQQRTATFKKREDSPNRTNRVLDESAEDDMNRTSVKKGARSIEKRPKDISGKTPQEEVEEYNAIFESLKKKTHKNDLKEILTLFEDYENKNYSLYQHLSHLSDEKEGLEKQIQQIKEEINHLTQHQQKDAGDDGGDNKSQKVQELKDEIEESDKHFKFLENKQAGLTETINALKISIPIIFERIGCNIEDYANELLDGTTVNEGNMLQYLAIIEKKTNEILQMYHFSQNRSDNGKAPGQEGLNRRGNEESMINASVMFPERELLNDLQTAPEKAEMQTAKDFQEYAKEKVKSLLDKKSGKGATKA